jgi:hypothetical protein
MVQKDMPRKRRLRVVGDLLCDLCRTDALLIFWAHRNCVDTLCIACVD